MFRSCFWRSISRACSSGGAFCTMRVASCCAVLGAIDGVTPQWAGGAATFYRAGRSLLLRDPHDSTERRVRSIRIANPALVEVVH